MEETAREPVLVDLALQGGGSHGAFTWGVLDRLLEDDELRERMGAAAAAHMRELRDGEATAHGYEHAIERTLELVRDPGRKAMAIWGKSLVDVGISEAMVAEGYGMEYARALESFKTSP